MKVILFCQNTYSFGILDPIKEVLIAEKHSFIWYVAEKILTDFPFKKDNHTTKISDLLEFQSDVIFVPGNAVPHYLKGLKVQIFHGLAGEKKGHFRIRHYFDLYLTQGPYFTSRFLALKEKHKDFNVEETGWPKLDVYAKNSSMILQEKALLLQSHKAKKIILYAPTFSPKLTSASDLLPHIKKLAQNLDYLILLKFHPLMDNEWISEYKNLANSNNNIVYETDNNIIKFLRIADLLISDTSSVIYEFLLLDKPVISFNNISQQINWENSTDYSQLIPLVSKNLNEDLFSKFRKEIFKNIHPYNDGKSASRMVEAVESHLNTHGVPLRRKLSFLRRMKIYSIFGKQYGHK